MVTLRSGGQKALNDYKLTRYGCYLIVLNGEPTNQSVALGQTYFAQKTRQQEVLEESANFARLTEEERRLKLRQSYTVESEALDETARNAGVVTPADTEEFHQAGYLGLYGGLGPATFFTGRGCRRMRRSKITWAATN